VKAYITQQQRQQNTSAQHACMLHAHLSLGASCCSRLLLVIVRAVPAIVPAQQAMAGVCICCWTTARSTSHLSCRDSLISVIYFFIAFRLCCCTFSTSHGNRRRLAGLCCHAHSQWKQ
jgi:hypothetical protein